MRVRLPGHPVTEMNGRSGVTRFKELCLDVVREESRDAYREVIASLVDRGAQAVVLGCTEISLLVSQTDSSVPLYDTARIHADAGVSFMLG